MGEYKNGDAVIRSCIFCDGKFSEPQEINKWIECECQETYKIVMPSSHIKQKDSETE